MQKRIVVLGGVARLGFKRIIVSGYLGKGGKRPKGIEIVTINSIDQLPRALFVE